VLRTRLLTAAVALPALWLIIWKLWDPVFNGFILAVTAIGLYEYFAMASPDDGAEQALGVGFGLCIAAGVVTQTMAGAAIALTVIAGFIWPLARHDDLPRAVGRLGILVLGVLYVGFLMPHVCLLRAQPEGWRWVIFTVTAAMGSDTGGYFAGRAVGRHKLLPAVSPGKTVEGSVGGLLGAVLGALVMRFLLLPGRPAGEVVGMGLAIGLLAQLGDLAESALKRAFGAKDSGWIIPGHGGILDRLDSLLFPFVFTYYYLAALPRG
jgi:phosphatidate cytidylyltransferase